jgi:hypothetical protein
MGAAAGLAPASSPPQCPLAKTEHWQTTGRSSLSYAALAQANRFRFEPVSAQLHPAPFSATVPLGPGFEMSSEDRPKLPRTSLRGEKLYIEGEKEPYFRDRTNDVLLRIEALTIRRGYTDSRDGKVFHTI